ncbi:Cytochrome c-552 [Rubrivivax sp. A210]|uniref:c-type cytochrome n=1 Tax=Rubrivivax sp. A210 TaxID=2772301 RepID=UPI00191B6ABE|nr:c-type cytochrome [Rubrivivax sp. A210]CAD5372435.1 Cytochrome c-552 [Rubrivivax sp. A210]
MQTSTRSLLVLLGALLVPGAALASPALAEKAGCGACHKVDVKLVGPSYKDVAAKYKTRSDAVPYLSTRVRQGGPGNWGVVPMMANDVSRISDADLKSLIEWILKTK